MTTAIIDYGLRNLPCSAQASHAAPAHHRIPSPAPVRPRDAAGPSLKIPHMGWSELSPRAAHPVLAGLPAGTHAYFVHSFELRPARPADLLAETDYGGRAVGPGAR